jgi:radical SAM superfamily enzyme YgiQ (UPF0313 family)
VSSDARTTAPAPGAAGPAPGGWSAPGAALLVSCYELGRQPFNIASPWAQLEAAGFGVDGIDTAVDELPDAAIERAKLIAISVPMHTATRLGIALAERVRRLNPGAHVCFFGLYAALNAKLLLATHADSVIGGEFEVALVDLAAALSLGRPLAEVGGVVSSANQLQDGRGSPAPSVLRRLPFVTPRRDRLAPLHRYATFFGPGPEELRQVGYVEASRGCLHRCRHCPVTPVYQGRFFVVPREVVLADARQQVAAGAGHLTFGDPDFFNGPTHGLKILQELHREHPTVSFDVTIKVEHMLRHREALAELPALGCAFVVSALESLSDEVLGRLDKGHTERDVHEAVALCRELGLVLRPTFVTFTPWTTLDDYVALVDWIVGEDLIDHIDPIQLAIRLLVPPGSALLEDEPEWLGSLAAEELGFRWQHPDARVDALFEQVSQIVERGVDDDERAVVLKVREAAYHAASRRPEPIALGTRRFVPHLSESWFCCAEPTQRQLENLR